MGETVLRLLPDGRIFVERVAEGMCYPPKRLDISDLEGIFARSRVWRPLRLEERSGLLPPDVVEVVTVSRGEWVGYIAVLRRDKGIRPYRFVDGKGKVHEFEVGYPGLLFRFTVFDGDVQELRVRAFKGRIEKDSQLYFYPYTNVYPNGAVCLGNYRYPKVRDLRDLGSYPDVFFELANNSDLYRGDVPLSELISANEGKEFDDSLLEPCGETYEEFMLAGIEAAAP